MATPERRLAEFVVDLTVEDLPPSVTERAGLTIADTVGTIIGGMSDPAVSGLIQQWQWSATGEATVLGADTQRVTKYEAAFLNATAGTVLELDEGHRFAAGHPAIHVLPALLADGENGYGSKEAFLAAFVAGYEVAVRVARAVTPLADGYHPHGVWGVVGGAAAVARLRNYTAEQTLDAMTIAANYAQHTRFAAATEGATVRNSFAGMSNLSSLVSADQAAAGFTGLDDGIQRHLERVAADDFDREALTAGLGEQWEIERGYFKTHAACRYTHATLDAVLTIIRDHELSAENVDSITVETYPAAARLTNTRPENSLQAKFSLPFAVSTTIVNGHSGKEAFTADAITEPVRSLAERVSVRVGDDIAARVPDARGSRVTITLADGTDVTEEVRAARGGEHSPFERPELEAKFGRLVAPQLDEERASDLWDAANEPAPPRVLSTLAR